MPEEYQPAAVQPGKRSIFSVIGGAAKMPFPLLAGIGLVAAIGIPLTIRQLDYQNFLRKPLVRLEGRVVDERYVQPTSGSMGQDSKYYFSIDTVEGRRGFKVMDSYNPRMSKESLDALLREGTTVLVESRNVAPGQYQAFANGVHVLQAVDEYVPRQRHPRW